MTVLKGFGQKSEKFLLQIQKIEGFVFFNKTGFSSKCSSRLDEYHFDSPAKKKLPTVLPAVL